jgi:hypothetical protein
MRVGQKVLRVDFEPSGRGPGGRSPIDIDDQIACIAQARRSAARIRKVRQNSLSRPAHSIVNSPRDETRNLQRPRCEGLMWSIPTIRQSPSSTECRRDSHTNRVEWIRRGCRQKSWQSSFAQSAFSSDPPGQSWARSSCAALHANYCSHNRHGCRVADGVAQGIDVGEHRRQLQ